MFKRYFISASCAAGLALAVILIAVLPYKTLGAPSPPSVAKIVSPNGGECFKGGSTQTISWTNGADTDHIALAYRVDGLQPQTWTNDSSAYFAHPVIGQSYDWTVPGDTTSNAKIWLDDHNTSHSSVSQDSSDSPFSIDSSAPSKPTLSNSSKTATSISLAWTASSDSGCKNLNGYKIYRGGALLSTATTDTLNYTDANLSANTSYNYKITAYDDFAETDSDSMAISTDTLSSPPTNDSSSNNPTTNNVSGANPNSQSTSNKSNNQTSSAAGGAPTNTNNNDNSANITSSTAVNQNKTTNDAAVKNGQVSPNGQANDAADTAAQDKSNDGKIVGPAAQISNFNRQPKAVKIAYLAIGALFASCLGFLGWKIFKK